MILGESVIMTNFTLQSPLHMNMIGLTHSLTFFIMSFNIGNWFSDSSFVNLYFFLFKIVYFHSSSVHLHFLVCYSKKKIKKQKRV